MADKYPYGPPWPIAINPSPSADAARGRRTMSNQDSIRKQHLSADNDSLRAENARLQARVEEAEAHACGWALRQAIKIGRKARALAERRKDALEPFDLCQNVQHKPAEYVTRDMAIDAGEPTMEGTMLRGVISEPCGNCDGCRARAAIEEEEK